MSKPLGKQSVRSAVEYLYEIMPMRFSTINLHTLVTKQIGRPQLFHDITLRKMRELREEGKINFKRQFGL